MRLAIIDLGTNSIRFDIHEVHATKSGTIQHRRLYREKAMVRLGQNLFIDGRLAEESKRRTLEAVHSFRETLDALQVTKTIAFGTAAVRDASDGEAFLKEIEDQTGIEFRVISGAEEASLIAKGVMELEDTPKGAFALVDIGGGSTEISICKGNKVLHSESFNLGVAKLQQVFLKTQPPTEAKKGQTDAVTQLRNFIKSVVVPKMMIERWPRVERIIGSSGSVIALAKLAKKDKDSAKNFSRKELGKIVGSIRYKTSAELLSMKGMEPKRVDLILAGAVLLDELAQLMSAKEIRPTEFALRDGILVDQLERFKKSKNKDSGFSFDYIEKRLQKWSVDIEHLHKVRENADFLFDKLRPVHKLKQEWKPYLSAAALLHDVGETISHAHHAEHSEYMIKNANFVGMQQWESQLIASVVRFHKEEKLLEKKNEKKIPYDKKHELRPVFLRLVALLQIADAFDRTHKAPLKLTKVKLSRGRVDIRFKSKGPCDLELLRLEQKKILFETIFKRVISAAKAR
ncbi:MAG: Ppx/GppA family phosphatase [Bdellovibrionales bacterium]|nr:Ppx/GppA family phosphatase [Bdellovibrionales bacterium]